MENNQIKRNDAVVKILGFIFITCFILPTFNWVFLMSGFTESGNFIKTAENIFANEALFRFGLCIKLLMSVGLLALASILYSILKNTNTVLARIAFSLKITEAALCSAIVLISFITLYTQNNYVGAITNNQKALFAVPMIFLGIDMTIFNYLFLKSRLVPKCISLLGILSFILIFIHSVMFLAAPEAASLAVIQAVFYTPSGLFEMIIGSWLMTKGLKHDVLL